ncbi:MAG: T9SS type A sorting domain-containing protein, partial [Bacteroidia bacterium]
NCSYSMSATNTVPLPITMMDFELYKNSNGVTAKWSTASEKNNKYFVLEKTTDGINFSEVGRVDGAGTSSAMHNYSYTDESPVYGISYYRIKQVDTDGTYSYSQMRAIDFKELAVSNFEVIPNPSESQAGVLLSFNESVISDLDINIYDISGTLLYNKTEQVKGNKIELPKFEKGFYIVHVTGPNFNKTKRMIVK